MAMAWYSYSQGSSIPNMDVEVRTSNPTVLLPEIRRVVRDLDPNAPLDNPKLLSIEFGDTYLMPALFARLGAFFGGLAALLVGVGLYGTLSYRLNRRVKEIGLRIALGASRGQVLRMVLFDSLILALIGLLVGVPSAWFVSKLMVSMLFKLQMHDPISFACAVAGILAVSILSALLPARGAANIQPMQALRID
jgi:ABC-type antimicrobial peptide transport system permease subunit